MKIDLHCHSRCSDGTETPETLVRMGCAVGLKLMALTDHDTAEGVPAFLAEAARLNMTALAGIEMSAAWPGTLHILGYGYDRFDVTFQERLAELRRCRDDRNVKMLSKLNGLGFGLSMEDVKREAGVGVIGRPHFAKALVRLGAASDLRDAFDRYLGRGRPAFVVKRGFPPAECISLIDQAGGRTVLAHPLQTAPLGALRPVVKELRALGLWGMECYSGHHDAASARALLELAGEFGLAVTAGSDFHGASRPSYHLGVTVPDTLIDWEAFGLKAPTWRSGRR